MIFFVFRSIFTFILFGRQFDHTGSSIANWIFLGLIFWTYKTNQTFLHNGFLISRRAKFICTNKFFQNLTDFSQLFFDNFSKKKSKASIFLAKMSHLTRFIRIFKLKSLTFALHYMNLRSFWTKIMNILNTFVFPKY